MWGPTAGWPVQAILALDAEPWWTSCPAGEFAFSCSVRFRVHDQKLSSQIVYTPPPLHAAPPRGEQYKMIYIGQEESSTRRGKTVS